MIKTHTYFLNIRKQGNDIKLNYISLNEYNENSNAASTILLSEKQHDNFEISKRNKCRLSLAILHCNELNAKDNKTKN